MTLKYELTTKTRKYRGHTLYQIRELATGRPRGWIEKESNLSQEGSCMVCDSAMVYGDARVHGDAWVYGDAQVRGTAQVYGNAVVSGTARVRGNAQVYGFAWVCDSSTVTGRARIFGNSLLRNAFVDDYARVYGQARISRATVCDRAIVRGQAVVLHDSGIIGNAILQGEAEVKNLQVSFGTWDRLITAADLVDEIPGSPALPGRTRTLL